MDVPFGGGHEAWASTEGHQAALAAREETPCTERLVGRDWGLQEGLQPTLEDLSPQSSSGGEREAAETPRPEGLQHLVPPTGPSVALTLESRRDRQRCVPKVTLCWKRGRKCCQAHTRRRE